MALTDDLNGKKVQDLIKDNTFIAALVPKLTAGAGDNGVYTKAEANAQLDNKVNITGDNATEAGVNTMLGKLTGDNVVVKVPDLTTKVNITGDNATEAGVNAMLGKLTGDNVVVKINASNLTDAANQKAFAEAILPAKEGNKSILVDKLEGFLAENAKAYSNNTKTAKELLVPSAAEIAAKIVNDPNLTVNVIDARIKEVMKETVSQPSFEIPTSDDAALNWTW